MGGLDARAARWGPAAVIGAVLGALSLLIGLSGSRGPLPAQAAVGQLPGAERSVPAARGGIAPAAGLTPAVFLPLVSRGNYQPPATFGIALPGDGVTLGAGPVVTSGLGTQAGPPLADWVNLQAITATNDGAFHFDLLLAGDPNAAPISHTLTYDIVGRPAEVRRAPAIYVDPPCQVSPRSNPKAFTAYLTGFPPHTLVNLEFEQIGGDERFSGLLRPVGTNAVGQGQTSFFFFSDQTKDWKAKAVTQISPMIATAQFRTSVGQDCPSFDPRPEVTSTLSLRPDFFSNATFDLHVERTPDGWDTTLRNWDGRRWITRTTSPQVSVRDRTIRVSAPRQDLGVQGNCLVWGALSRTAPPGSSQGTGKAGLLDRQRGPLGSFCAELGFNNPPGPLVQAWSGCDGSHAGLLAPPCSSTTQVGTGLSTRTSHSPPGVLGGVIGGPAVPPRVCTSDTLCPPVGISIWIRPDGLASLDPYGQFGPFAFFVSTNPPSPGGAYQVNIFQSDYFNIPALSSVARFIGTLEYQNLLLRYRSNLAPVEQNSFDAAGTAIYPPAGGYNFSQLDRYMRVDLRGLVWFSQVPMTFSTADGSTKFIADLGLAYVPSS